ncbi:MAG TPA: hypothetical protein VFF94_04155, partial [Novosphingobium sp.]|nr:hypothetical protein [Novosphingobium sp.]
MVFAEEFLPAYDVSDEVAMVVSAAPQAVWEALVDTDLIEVGRRTPLAGLLGALRVLPELVSHLLHGERPPHAPASLRLREISDLPPDQGGWVLLGKQPALGPVGKFWRPVIEYPHVPAERFRDFREPGYPTTVDALSVRPLADGRSLLSGLMRTATIGEHARRLFRRYCTFGVGSGAYILVQALLKMIRETAERAQAEAAEQ